MTIVVTKCEAPRCPRCYKHTGIPTAPRNLCDPCQKVLLEMDFSWAEPEENRLALVGLQDLIRVHAKSFLAAA